MNKTESIVFLVFLIIMSLIFSYIWLVTCVNCAAVIVIKFIKPDSKIEFGKFFYCFPIAMDSENLERYKQIKRRENDKKLTRNDKALQEI